MGKFYIVKSIFQILGKIVGQLMSQNDFILMVNLWFSFSLTKVEYDHQKYTENKLFGNLLQFLFFCALET